MMNQTNVETVGCDDKATSELVTEARSPNEEKNVITDESTPSKELAAPRCKSNTAKEESGRTLNTDIAFNWDVQEFSRFFSKKNSLMRWCIEVGLVNDNRSCCNCQNVREWKCYSDGIEYWMCKDGKEFCEMIPVNEKTTFVYDRLSMGKIVTLLYVWWINSSISHRMELNWLSIEDNDHFDATLREICIFGCMNERRKIGGHEKSVSVEIGLRMGITCQLELLIGGVELDNYSNLFLTHLNLANRTHSELTTFIEKWIDPETKVLTSSALLEPFKDLGWRHQNTWTLEFNTGCLAEDLWRQRLLCTERPFEELVKTVSKYFEKSMVEAGNSFIFDTNQVNIKEIAEDLGYHEIDLTLNPWHLNKQ